MTRSTPTWAQASTADLMASATIWRASSARWLERSGTMAMAIGRSLAERASELEAEIGRRHIAEARPDRLLASELKAQPTTRAA